MGFFRDLSFSNIEDFIKGNVKSAVKDSAHLVQQYVNNPITSAIAPTALSAIGVPPEAYNVVKNLQNKGLNSLQGIKEAVAGTEYSQEIQGLNEEQFQAMLKMIEEEKRQEEEKKKKENRKKLYIVLGGVFLIVATSFVTYKILKKK
jgi:hypothetical protein